MLLENGADPNLTTLDFETALHFASEKGNTEMVELLLKYDVDIDASGFIFGLRFSGHNIIARPGKDARKSAPG